MCENCIEVTIFSLIRKKYKVVNHIAANLLSFIVVYQKFCLILNLKKY
jgi:hypothetical protein